MADIYMSGIRLLEDAGKAKEALDGVDSDRRKKAADCANGKMRAQMLTAGLLVQHGARVMLGDEAPDGIYDFAYTELGKPYFINIPGVHFSISHSGEMAMVAVSDREVGADIQEWRELKSDIAGRFFHPEEKAHLEKLSASESEKAFFELWCLKESYIKFTGKGLTQALDELNFLPVVTGGGYGVFEFTENGTRIAAQLVDAPHGYSAAFVEEVIGDEY